VNRIVLLSLLALVLTVVALLGFRGQTSRRPPLQPWNDMTEQSKHKPQAENAFFADGRAQRSPPPATVPWGRDATKPDPRFAQAAADSYALEKIPVPIDRALLLKGRETFDLYCAVCHGRAGDGQGITTRFGMVNPPSYHDERLRKMPAGEILKVITEGKGQMGPYAGKIALADRWAVIAWVRALQRAWNATLDDVPEDRRKELGE
jgi:mono/diheme cytochrome c family protein